MRLEIEQSSELPTVLSPERGSDSELEELVTALEQLAFKMLAAENQLCISGREADVKTVAEWRSGIRNVAQVIRRWKIRSIAAAIPANTEDEQMTKCQFCPRPSGMRASRCKWHV